MDTSWPFAALGFARITGQQLRTDHVTKYDTITRGGLAPDVKGTHTLGNPRVKPFSG